MASATYELILEAVLNKTLVSAVYQGHYREMCPHVIGFNRRGQEQVLCYQYGGTSSSGLAPAGSSDNWRCMPIRGLSDVKVLKGGPWRSADRPGRQPQTCVARVIAVAQL